MAKDTKAPGVPRMTRAQIAEALDTIPLDSILMGASTESRLTPKQKEFARNLALGKSKAQSYRESHNSKGTKKTQANHGYRLSQSEDIQAIKRAYEVAIEAAKQRTPAQLRELVIHQLTAHAIDQDIPPAQRIQALKLLGTVSEVAAFTERKEVHTVKRSEDVRAALVEKLRLISGSVSDAVLVNETESADSLLEEISAGHAANAAENSRHAPDADPPALDPTRTAPPGRAFTTLSQDLHNVPHSGSPEKFVPHSRSQELSNPIESDAADSLDISAVDDNVCLSAIGDIDVIGVDEHVSPCITEAELIVTEKVPAGGPTPSDMEDPPACSETEKG